MGSQAETEWAAFEEKVGRTVLLDCLSPLVTEAVIRKALDQFGCVVNVEFIPNYSEAKNMPCCALLEMETPKQAKSVVEEISNFPFMISGMPRPVRAFPAEPEMFENRPVKPGRRIFAQWIDPSLPDFEVAKKLKRLTQKHALEAQSLTKHLLAQEGKLAKQQAETLKLNYLKFEMVDSVVADKTARRVAQHYGMRIMDD